VKKLFIPVVCHRQHLGHRVMYTFHPNVADWVVGAGVNFQNPENLMNGVRKIDQKLEAVAREDAGRAAPAG